MGTLPWQVEYGQWIGWSAAAALVVLGCVLFWLWLRWVAQRRTRDRLSDFGFINAFPEPGPVVLRAKLTVPGAPVPALDGSGAAAACTVEASSETLRFAPHQSRARKCFRAPSLRVVTKEGAVSLRGAVVVTHGSRQTFPGHLTSLDSDDRERLLAEPDEILSFGTSHWPNALRVPAMIRTVRHGDVVIVRGTIRPRTGDSGPGASYRPSDTDLEIIPDEGKDAIELTAVETGTLTFGKRALVTQGVTVGIVLSLFVGLVAGGSARRVDDFATAALFPPHRAWALNELSKQATQGPASAQRLGNVLAYEAAAPDCQRTGEALMAHGQWRRAAKALAGCREPRFKKRAVTAYVMAGNLSQACNTQRDVIDDSGERALYEAQVFAMGSCLPEAADALRRHAKGIKQEDRRGAIECAADALDAQSNNAQAMAALSALSAKHSEFCRLAHASLLSGQERAKALSFLVESPNIERARHQYGLLRDILWASVRKDPSVMQWPALPPPSRFFSSPDRVWSTRAHGLEHAILQQLAGNRAPNPRRRYLRAVLAVRAAAFETLAGDVAEAALWLDLATKDLSLLPRTLQPAEAAWLNRTRASAQIASLRVIGHLLRGRIKQAQTVVDTWAGLAASHFLDDRPPSESLPAAWSAMRRDAVLPIEDAKALVTAAKGQRAGQPIAPEAATWLFAGREALRLGPRPPLVLLAVAPEHVKPNNDALKEWITYEARQPVDQPISLLVHAALAARGAQILGLPQAHKQHLSAASGLREGLLRREAALVFALVRLP